MWKIGSDQEWDIRSAPEFGGDFEVTHIRTGLFVQCGRGCSVGHAKKLILQLLTKQTTTE